MMRRIRGAAPNDRTSGNGRADCRRRPLDSKTRCRPCRALALEGRDHPLAMTLNGRPADSASAPAPPSFICSFIIVFVLGENLTTKASRPAPPYVRGNASSVVGKSGERVAPATRGVYH